MRSATVGARPFGGVLSRGGRWVRRERVLGPLLVLPAFLYVALLVGLPFFYALYLSLTDATTGNPYGSFVGLRNFVEVVQTPVFRNALKNTFVFTLSAQLAVVILANILATALNADFRGKGFVLFLILLPWVAPVSLATIGWLWILHARFSILDWVMWQLGLLPRDTNMFWLGKPNLAMFSVCLLYTSDAADE